ncbi:hypothetical protein AK812_SmicGene22166 [Symbiodinium microadriaticum]|uniref:Uncharacterized protein n=1 Tax=Symbiodinium microadriaticum TaxID=2951 RepID=A0A1Q9DKL0_SYMMI|nr:hypothetical protein AK812_SmicGene22166 [Symbiodinium microadriaticum]
MWAVLQVSEVQVALGSACIFERRRLSMEEATTLLTQEMQHFPELANVTVVVQSLENSIFADDSVIPEPSVGCSKDWTTLVLRSLHRRADRDLEPAVSNRRRHAGRGAATEIIIVVFIVHYLDPAREREPVRPTGLDPFIIVAIVLSSLCILVLCAIVPPGGHWEVFPYRFCRNKCGQKTPQTDTSRAETSVVPGQGTDDFDVQDILAVRADIFAGSQEYGGDLEFQMGTGDHEVMLEFDARPGTGADGVL